MAVLFYFQPNILKLVRVYLYSYEPLPVSIRSIHRWCFVTVINNALTQNKIKLKG